MKSIKIDTLGAVLFLILSLVYGYYSFDIKLLPGEENEPFNSRTLPFILSFLGAFLALVEIVLSVKKTSENDKGAPLVWPKQDDFLKFLKLVVAVCLYAFSLKYVGFLLATVVFIFICAWVLGERNPKTLILSSLVFVICFWVLLKYGLDIYIETGQLFK